MSGIVTIDPSTGAIYLYLPAHPRTPGCVARTVEAKAGSVMIDLDACCTPIGVEVLHSALTPAQRHARSLADRAGRAYVTMIDGRVAIILPESGKDNADGEEYIAAAISDALGKAGAAFAMLMAGLCPWCRRPFSQPTVSAEHGLTWSCLDGCNP